MSLIEGIGDEVTHFFIILFVTLTVCIAWWTTNTHEQRHLRTVFLIERRLRRQRTHNRLTNHTQASTLVEASPSQTNSETNNSNIEENEIETVTNPKPPDAEPSTSGVEENESDSASPEPTREEDDEEADEQNAILETMDADNSTVRQRRIAFFGQRQDTFLSRSSATEKSTTVSSNLDTESNENRDEGVLKIKLKYINDDLKIVEGHVQEHLGDFKRRHFDAELSSNKLVRLIFNGRVLQDEASTLGNYGLFNNCVVHCLVHQKRTTVPNEEDILNMGSASARNGLPNLNNNNNNNNNNQARESELGNILFLLVTFVLSFAWYIRYAFAHLYTVTATIALVAVTGIFTVLLIGLYYPDHRPTPQEASQTENVQQR